MKLLEKFFDKETSCKIENTVICKSSSGSCSLESPIKKGSIVNFDYRYNVRFPLYKVIIALFCAVLTFVLFHNSCVKKYKKYTEEKLRVKMMKKYKNKK